MRISGVLEITGLLGFTWAAASVPGLHVPHAVGTTGYKPGAVRQPSHTWALRARGGGAQGTPVPSAKVPLGTSSVPTSIFNLAKNIIGGGMLALPAGMAAGQGTGWVPAFGIMATTCLLSAYTYVILGKSVEQTKSCNFKELWASTLGEKSAWIVDAAIMALCFGVAVMYGCFLGDLVSSLASITSFVPSWLGSRTGSILGVTGVVLLPLCLLKDLSALGFSSILGLLAVGYITVFMGIRRFDGTYSLAEADSPGRFLEGLTHEPSLQGGSLWGLGLGTSVLFSMLSTAFMAHPNAVKFYNELEGRSPRKFAKVVYTSFGVAGLVYGAVMALGYQTFGQASQGLILNNYHSRADKLAVLARAATAVSIIGSQPLLFTGLRESAISMGQSQGWLPQDLDSRPGLWAGLSIGLLAAATLLAIVTPDVGLVVSLVGSLLGAGMVYSLPAAVFLGALKKMKAAGQDRGVSSTEIGNLHLLVMFGAIMAVVGTSVTVLENFTSVLKK